MFSSSNSVPSAERGRHGSAKDFFTQVPKGFSINTFKGPTLSSYPYTATATFDLEGYRPNSYSSSWPKPSWSSLRKSAETKSILAPRGMRTRLSSFSSITRRPLESNHSQRPSSFSIYPNNSDDTLIYERSFPSKSDIYPNAADSDDISESAFSTSTFLSSPSSSDSTETLHNTPVAENFPGVSSCPPSPARRSFPLHAHHLHSSAARMGSADHNLPSASYDAFIRAPFLSNSTLPPSIQSHAGNAPTINGSAGQEHARPMESSFGMQSVAPFRGRNGAAAALPEIQSAVEDSRYDSQGRYFFAEQENTRSSSVPPQSGGWRDHAQNAPPGLRPARANLGFSRSEPTRNKFESTNRRPDLQKLTILIPSRSHNTTPISNPEYRGVTTNTRCVRWDENLICPSPTRRRKGWFNRKGDQLWTNDGVYKPPKPGREFPTDLQDYPEYGEGWMNEQGVRIDMEHRRIQMVPLRSALKRPQVIDENRQPGRQVDFNYVGF